MTHALHYNRSANDRRTHQPVRADSFDIEDRRAAVARPNKLGMVYVDALMEVFDKWDDQLKKPGSRHSLGLGCRRVLRALLRNWDFKTGICEPCYDTLMRQTKLARGTIARAIKLLETHGFISYIRRTEKTGNAPGEGPQVRQVSNAYWFDASRLTRDAFDRLQRLLKKRGRSANDQPAPPKRFEGILARRRVAVRDEVAYRRRCLHNAHQRQDWEEVARLTHPNDPRLQAETVAMYREVASSGSGLNPPPTEE